MVLALLLARRGGVVSVDQLVDELWPRELPADPRMLVHGYVSRLRRALKGQASRLQTRKPGYALTVGETEWDVYVFEQLIADARLARSAGQLERSAKLFGEAHELWLGEPFADVPGATALSAAAKSFTELRLSGLEEWFDNRLALGGDRELVHDLTREVAAHPLREQLVALQMQALDGSGRRAEALASFRHTRGLLIGEHGMEPGPDLQRVHQQLLQDRPAAPAQLPLAVPGFTGRASQIAELDRATTVAVVTGTAGVGKSALAVHWAHQARQRFPDGELFVNLRGFDPRQSEVDPGEALVGFLETLGVPAARIPSSTDARAALFRSVLAGKRVLVLLDNARDEEQVRPLLPGTAGSLALVTSRDPLTSLVAVEGARSVFVDVLSEAESGELLAARLADPGTTGDPAFARIVRHCAGLPLALAVVAATWVTQPSLSLDTIASDLDSGVLDALDSPDPKTDLRSVFSWSYRALSPPAAAMFRVLGLHPGPDMPVAAAAALAGTDQVIAQRLLMELHRAHLIVQHRPGRFSSHDLLRAYSAERAAMMAPGARAKAQERLLEHYAHTAVAAAQLLDPQRRPIVFEGPGTDVVITALGGHADAMAWFEEEHAALVDIACRTGSWQLAWALSTYLRRRNHGRDWVRTQRAALAAAQLTGDTAGQANAALQLAMAEFCHGDDEASAKALEEAIAHFDVLGDHHGLATACHLQCLRAERDGDYATAFVFADKGFEYYHRAADGPGQGRALSAMGWYQARLGNPSLGLTYGNAALEAAQFSGDLPGEASAWEQLARIHLLIGDPETARHAFENGAALQKAQGDHLGLVRALSGLAESLEAQGAQAEADEARRQARKLTATQAARNWRPASR